MASVRLPLVGPLTQARVGALAGALLVAGTDAPAHRIGNAAWLRVSAHAYNTMEDYARLADTLARVLPAA
jgi:isopenicillin-N epimerase